MARKKRDQVYSLLAPLHLLFSNWMKVYRVAVVTSIS